MSDWEVNAFRTVRSRVDDLPPQDELVPAIRGYDLALLHTLGGVELLRASTLEVLPADLLELRAFDARGELHMVIVDGQLRGRVRVDEGRADASVTVFDEEHVLWGTRLTGRDHKAFLDEDRGTRVVLPEGALAGFVEGESVATIGVRNYLGEEAVDPESGDTAFSFTDWRLVGLHVRRGDGDE